MTSKLKKNIKEKIRDIEDQRSILIAIIDEYIGESRHDAESLLSSSDNSSFLQKYMEVMQSLDRCYNTCVLLTAEAEETLENFGKARKTCSSESEPSNTQYEQQEQRHQPALPKLNQGNQSKVQSSKQRERKSDFTQQTQQLKQTEQTLLIASEDCSNVVKCPEKCDQRGNAQNQSTITSAQNFNITSDHFTSDEISNTKVHEEFSPFTETEGAVSRSHVNMGEEKSITDFKKRHCGDITITNDFNLNENYGKPLSEKLMNIVKVKEEAEEEKKKAVVRRAIQEKTTLVRPAIQEKTTLVRPTVQEKTTMVRPTVQEVTEVTASLKSKEEYNAVGEKMRTDDIHRSSGDRNIKLPEQETYYTEIDQFKPRVDMEVAKRFLKGIINQASKDNRLKSEHQNKAKVIQDSSSVFHDSVKANTPSVVASNMSAKRSVDSCVSANESPSATRKEQVPTCVETRSITCNTVDTDVQHNIGVNYDDQKIKSTDSGEREDSGLLCVSSSEKSETETGKTQTNIGISCKTENSTHHQTGDLKFLEVDILSTSQNTAIESSSNVTMGNKKGTNRLSATNNVKSVSESSPVCEITNKQHSKVEQLEESTSVKNKISRVESDKISSKLPGVEETAVSVNADLHTSLVTNAVSDLLQDRINSDADKDISTDAFFAYLSSCSVTRSSLNSSSSSESDTEQKNSDKHAMDASIGVERLSKADSNMKDGKVCNSKEYQSDMLQEDCVKGTESASLDIKTIMSAEKEGKQNETGKLKSQISSDSSSSLSLKHGLSEQSLSHSDVRDGHSLDEQDVGYGLGPTLTSEHIEVNKITSVVISEPCSPWLFYVQKYSTDLRTLMNKMSMYLSTERQDAQRIATPVKGMICLAKFSIDKLFYRAKIIHVHEKDKSVDVIFVDYGNVERRKPEHLRELPAVFTQLPAQAIPCALAKVTPSNKYNVWTEDDILDFARYVTGQRFNCLPIHVDTESDQPALVELFYNINVPQPVRQGSRIVLMSNLQQVSIYELFLKKGSAQKINVEEQINLLSGNLVSDDCSKESSTDKNSKTSKDMSDKNKKDKREGQRQKVTERNSGCKDSQNQVLGDGSTNQNATDMLPRIPRPKTKSHAELSELEKKNKDSKSSEELDQKPNASKTNKIVKENSSKIDSPKAPKCPDKQQPENSAKQLSLRAPSKDEEKDSSKIKRQQYYQGCSVGLNQKSLIEGKSDKVSDKVDTSSVKSSAVVKGQSQKVDEEQKKSSDSSGKIETYNSKSGDKVEHGKTENKLSASDKCMSVDSLESASIHYPSDDELNIPSSFDVHTDRLNVMLSHINSPTDFYVHLVSQTCGQTLNDIMKSLNKRLQQMSHKKLKKLSKSFNVYPGDLCAAKCTDDDQFYRALVTSIQLSSPVKRSADSETDENMGSIHVFYLDYGDREILPRRRVYPLPSELMEIGGLSLHCTLAYIKPLVPGNFKGTVNEDTTWSNSAKEMFVSQTGFEKTFQMLVIRGNVLEVLESHPSVAEKAPPLKVLLVDTLSTQQDICINMELIRLGHAEIDPKDVETKEVSTPDKLNTWDPMTEDYLSVRNSYNIDVNDAGVATTGYKANDESRICKYFKTNDCWRGDRCPYRHVLEPPGALTMDLEFVYANWDEVHQDEILPEPGTWIACEVSTIITPAHFYIILPWGKKPLEMVEKEDADKDNGGGSIDDTLERLMADMQDHYNSKAFQSHYVHYAAGEIVAAKFTGDNQWYRARVVCVDEQELQVFYLDFGNKEWVKESNIQRIEPFFLQLPFQAVECFLLGIEPYDGCEPNYKDAKQAMRKMVDGKTLVGYIKSRSWGGCVWLELFDTTGDDDVSIARSLIDLGLAQESSKNKTSASTSGVTSFTSSRVPSNESLILIPG